MFGLDTSLIIAVSICMIVTVISTEFLKKIIFWIDPKNGGGKALLLSWMIGIVFYICLKLFGFYKIDIVSISSFITITGFMNAGYKFTGIKSVIRKLTNGWMDEDKEENFNRRLK